jgi:hypothetical protein
LPTIIKQLASRLLFQKVKQFDYVKNISGVPSFNPLPVQFKSLLHGQEGCVFFSGHLNVRKYQYALVRKGQQRVKVVRNICMKWEMENYKKIYSTNCTFILFIIHYEFFFIQQEIFYTKGIVHI